MFDKPKIKGGGNRRVINASFGNDWFIRISINTGTPRSKQSKVLILMA